MSHLKTPCVVSVCTVTVHTGTTRGVFKVYMVFFMLWYRLFASVINFGPVALVLWKQIIDTLASFGFSITATQWVQDFFFLNLG